MRFVNPLAGGTQRLRRLLHGQRQHRPKL